MRRCSSPTPPAPGTPAGSPPPTTSTWTGPGPCRTWASARACTPAWVRRWPGCCCGRARRPARAAAGPAAGGAVRGAGVPAGLRRARDGGAAAGVDAGPGPDRPRTDGDRRPRRAAAAVPVTVAARRELTADVVELTLTVDAPGPLPDWEPGAHIDLELPDGALRQYSLCGRPGTGELRIAVLREEARPRRVRRRSTTRCGPATGCASAVRATTSGSARRRPCSSSPAASGSPRCCR